MFELAAGVIYKASDYQDSEYTCLSRYPENFEVARQFAQWSSAHRAFSDLAGMT
jgi:hypothetical protein